MSDQEKKWFERAADMRREFDGSFAHAPPARPEAFHDFLAIRVRGQSYALRLAQISGLFAEREVTAVRSPVVELLGIADFRGTIVPVYDLGALLGERVRADLRWLAVAAQAPVAFAFDAFDGHLREPASAVASATAASARPHLREVLRSAGVERPIVDLSSLVETIKKSALLATTRKD